MPSSKKFQLLANQSISKKYQNNKRDMSLNQFRRKKMSLQLRRIMNLQLGFRFKVKLSKKPKLLKKRNVNLSMKKKLIQQKKTILNRRLMSQQLWLKLQLKKTNKMRKNLLKLLKKRLNKSSNKRPNNPSNRPKLNLNSKKKSKNWLNTPNLKNLPNNSLLLLSLQLNQNHPNNLNKPYINPQNQHQVANRYKNYWYLGTISLCDSLQNKIILYAYSQMILFAQRIACKWSHLL